MRACLGRGCEGPRRTPLRSQGTAACHSHFIVVQFRIAPRRLLAFPPFQRGNCDSRGWGEPGGARWGGGLFAKLQGTVPYKESRQQIEHFDQALGAGPHGPTRQAWARTCGSGMQRVLFS